MKKIKNFFLNLQFIAMPSYWIMNYHYSKEWDRKLNELLECHDFTDISYYTAKIGEYEIWIENSPYASMRPYTSLKIYPYRPSRLTIKKATKKLIEARSKQLNSTFNLI